MSVNSASTLEVKQLFKIMVYFTSTNPSLPLIQTVTVSWLYLADLTTAIPWQLIRPSFSLLLLWQAGNHSLPPCKTAETLDFSLNGGGECERLRVAGSDSMTSAEEYQDVLQNIELTDGDRRC